MRSLFVIVYYFIGSFMLLAVILLFAVGMSLFFPETLWAKIWFVKKEEYVLMLQHRIWFGIGFWVLSLAMGITGIGWFLKREWARKMAFGIFLFNGLSDGIKLIAGEFVGGGIGVCASVLICLFVSNKRTRYLFSTTG